MYFLLSMGNIYDKLVNRVFTSCQKVLLKRDDLPETETDFLQQFRRPFVTVSREPGSGGKPVAKLVAKSLGFAFYDRQLITDLSQSTRKRSSLLKSIDEKKRTVIEDMVQGMFNPEYVSSLEYIQHLSSVILSAAIKGEVVILGRGAHLITPFEKGFHVRISAPYSVRVERAVKYEDISREEAIEKIKKIDSDRKEFISQYFSKDISNSNYYDLIINTTDMSIEAAAEHVILGIKNKFPEYAKQRKQIFSKLILGF